jgi:hypothetical protein
LKVERIRLKPVSPDAAGGGIRLTAEDDEEQNSRREDAQEDELLVHDDSPIAMAVSDEVVESELQ